jgi:hypothetical protein
MPDTGGWRVEWLLGWMVKGHMRKVLMVCKRVVKDNRGIQSGTQVGRRTRASVDALLTRAFALAASRRRE